MDGEEVEPRTSRRPDHDAGGSPRAPAPARARGHRSAAAPVLAAVALLAIGGVTAARRFADPHGSLGRLLGTESTCGNGQVESGEECDDGNARADDGCLTDCRRARCGDGVMRTHVEACDDGNLADGDGCSRACLVCPPAADRFSWSANGHCYVRAEATVTWDEAAAACGREGGHLVAYADDREWKAITDRLLGGAMAPVWIGLRKEDRNGLRDFAWVSGERVLSAHWALQEPRRAPPNLDCGAQLASGAWAAAACDERRAYVCERPAWVADTRNRHAYSGVVRKVTWAEARDACAASGGHLVTLRDLEEQAFVTTRFQGAIWIGASSDDGDGKYRWANREPFSYSDFAPGEPNLLQAQRCLALDVDRRWYSRDCTDRYNFVCEVE